MVAEIIDQAAACWWLDLPQTGYQQALDLQLAVVNAKTEGRLLADVIICVEHPRVFTLGRRGGRENLCVSDGFLDKQGVSVVPTDRGGNITYHGPGQLVVYPIIKLHRLKLKVVEFVSGLEKAMIRTAGDWRIVAGTDPANRERLTLDDCMSLRDWNSVLDGHPNPVEGFPFFDAATGSLGQGLSIAAGLVEGAKLEGRVQMRSDATPRKAQAAPPISQKEKK